MGRLEDLMPWAIFLLSAAVIVYAGTKLSGYGDQLAKLTGLGGLWIGVVLMAGATSLPEIFTTVSAGWLNTPDLAAAPLLAWSAGRIAEETGTSATFIGTSLVAITTSLPELVVAIAVVRLGAFDLAVGNLFGSNAFNMAAFLFADLVYRDGGMLDSVSSTHALTAL
jgi:Ca2+/Na+ antiporter